MSEHTLPDILSEAEAALTLGCVETTVQEHARKGTLPGLKFGEGGWVFPRAALLHALNKMAMDQAVERASKGLAPRCATLVEMPRRMPVPLPQLPELAGSPA